MQFDSDILEWLLDGDVSVQYQVFRDLLDEERPDLRERIENEGWGARFLGARGPHKHWGRKFYQPKWISSHYTLLDLRNLCIDPEQPEIRETINLIADTEKSSDGGVNPHESIGDSDMCVNGMFLNYASYFKTEAEKLKSVVDYIIRYRMSDGGFNCQLTRSGARHSSLHTTISVLEGITEYQVNGYTYRLSELSQAADSSKEFILKHQLFKSDHTGEVINHNFLKLSFPGRWKYDILRAMDYFRYSGTSWDPRMNSAMEVIMRKRNKDGTWNLQAKHPGQQHFEMEKAGKPSRWNTLRALRVFKAYEADFETRIFATKVLQ